MTTPFVRRTTMRWSAECTSRRAPDLGPSSDQGCCLSPARRWISATWTTRSRPCCRQDRGPHAQLMRLLDHLPTGLLAAQCLPRDLVTPLGRAGAHRSSILERIIGRTRSTPSWTASSLATPKERESKSSVLVQGVTRDSGELG